MKTTCFAGKIMFVEQRQQPGLESYTNISHFQPSTSELTATIISSAFVSSNMSWNKANSSQKDQSSTSSCTRSIVAHFQVDSSATNTGMVMNAYTCQILIISIQNLKLKKNLFKILYKMAKN